MKIYIGIHTQSWGENCAHKLNQKVALTAYMLFLLLTQLYSIIIIVT